jgi:uncharacterized protein YecA (UPF0149 family)
MIQPFSTGCRDMNQQPLTEADYDRIEVLLDSPLAGESAMQLDEVQAMLCAVVSAPDPIQPGVWLPEVSAVCCRPKGRSWPNSSTS